MTFFTLTHKIMEDVSAMHVPVVNAHITYEQRQEAGTRQLTQQDVLSWIQSPTSLGKKQSESSK